ncbi:MAG: T9SS type A sorting domain-containing protein, partial [Bacteroidota bacterium]
QVDFDGTATLSDIQVIEFTRSGNIKGIQVFPNPAIDQTMIDLGDAIREETQARLFNSNGQLIRQFVLPEGIVNYNLQIGELPNGSYLLNIDTADGTQTIPFNKVSKE